MAIGTVPSLIVGVGAGAAASAAFEPALERPKQDAWLAAPNRLPEIGLIAALVAGGKVTKKDGHNMAARLGYDTGPMDSLTWLAQDRLSFELMLRLWRLFPDYVNANNKSIAALLDETLAHEQLDWDYHELLLKLRHAEKPGIGDIAYSVVRGYLPTDIKLPVPPPATHDYVPRFPQSGKKAEAWANEIGYDSDALEMFIARSGLSMAPIMAANALFRSNAAADINALPAVPGVAAFGVKPYVGPNDYLLAISEGDLRTEWADAVRETAREILTASQYAELELRGFIDKPTRRALTRQHGMSDFDSDLQYDVLGRSLNVHQMLTGDRRMAQYGPPASGVPDEYLRALQRENLRPEYYDRAYANRHTLPSAFVIRSLLTDGALTETEGENLYLYEGWPEALAHTVASHYAGKAGSSTDPHVKKAQTTLYTTTHKSYVADEISDATATASLQAAGVAAASIPAVLQVWQVERDMVRKQLSAAQLKKAWSEGVVNPATNAPWTEAEATARLLELGYSADDAAVFLSL